MNNIAITFMLICSVLLSGCNNTLNDKKNTEYNIGYEYVIELPNSSTNFSEIADEEFKNAEDFLGKSKNFPQWNVSEEEIFGLYRSAINSDELIEHIIAMYDNVKDIDGDGDNEYILASRFGFSDIKDSLIVFDKDSDGIVKIEYNSAEDDNVNWLDFQNITGHFYDCPINSTIGLDGRLYEPTYSSDTNFKLGDDNTFYTARWSNMNVHNICYKIEYDGTKYSLVKLSDSGWKAAVIYENEEPTNKCRIICTDFMKNEKS